MSNEQQKPTVPAKPQTTSGRLQESQDHSITLKGAAAAQAALKAMQQEKK